MLLTAALLSFSFLDTSRSAHDNHPCTQAHILTSIPETHICCHTIEFSALLFRSNNSPDSRLFPCMNQPRISLLRLLLAVRFSRPASLLLLLSTPTQHAHTHSHSRSREFHLRLPLLRSLFCLCSINSNPITAAATQNTTITTTVTLSPALLAFSSSHLFLLRCPVCCSISSPNHTQSSHWFSVSTPLRVSLACLLGLLLPPIEPTTLIMITPPPMIIKTTSALITTTTITITSSPSLTVLFCRIPPYWFEIQLNPSFCSSCFSFARLHLLTPPALLRFSLILSPLVVVCSPLKRALCPARTCCYPPSLFGLMLFPNYTLLLLFCFWFISALLL